MEIRNWITFYSNENKKLITAAVIEDIRKKAKSIRCRPVTFGIRLRCSKRTPYTIGKEIVIKKKRIVEIYPNYAIPINR